MNLYTEVNSFYDWLETNPLATSDIVLWHALMHVANKAGWPDKFAVAVSVLELKTGLKKDAICDARNRLEQRGRIKWETRKGNQSAQYRIIPFVSVNPPQVPTQIETVSDKTTQSPTQSPTQLPTQSPTINILDNTSLKDNIPYFEIITALNEIAGTKYRVTDKHKTFIRARWGEEYTLDDFKTVIRKKAQEWLGTEQAKYLRPETLFGTKFDSYLNQPDDIKQRPSKRVHNNEPEVFEC